MTGYGLDIYTFTNGVQQWEKAGLVAGYTAYIACRGCGWRCQAGWSAASACSFVAPVTTSWRGVIFLDGEARRKLALARLLWRPISGWF